MLVDCDRCRMRDRACPECAVGVLLGMPERAEPSGSETSSGAPGVPPRATDRAGRDVAAGGYRGARRQRRVAQHGTPPGPSPAPSEAPDRPVVSADTVVEKWPSRRPFDLDESERRAITALIDGGLIPPFGPAGDPNLITPSYTLIAERGQLAG